MTYLEERVRQLTGATSVTALNTGMAAIHYALTAVSAAGLNIVASKHLFGNSVSLIRDTLGNFGVEPRFADFTNPDEVAALIDDKTCALFFEIITNPQLFVADIRKLADIAHQAGVPLIADTTIVPFSAFRAIDFGVDIEVVSSTKYISGGGTGLGGLLIDYGKFDWSQSPSPALQSRIKKVGKKLAFTARVKTELVTNLGALMTPQAAYMETLGLDTLDIRFRRQAETTLWLARQCQQLPEIKRVNYTGLEDNPFYELSKAQFGPLPGAVFTIDLESKVIHRQAPDHPSRHEPLRPQVAGHPSRLYHLRSLHRRTACRDVRARHHYPPQHRPRSRRRPAGGYQTIYSRFITKWLAERRSAPCCVVDSREVSSRRQGAE